MSYETLEFTRMMGDIECMVSADVIDGVVKVSEQFFIILMKESGWKLNEQGTNS